MTEWSAKFNALPIEVRRIGNAMESKTRIQQLEMEKTRLRLAFQKANQSINQQILIHKQSLRDMDPRD